MALSTVRRWAPVRLIGTPNARTIEADNRDDPGAAETAPGPASPTGED